MSYRDTTRDEKTTTTTARGQRIIIIWMGLVQWVANAKELKYRRWIRHFSRVVFVSHLLLFSIQKQTKGRNKPTKNRVEKKTIKKKSSCFSFVFNYLKRFIPFIYIIFAWWLVAVGDDVDEMMLVVVVGWCVFRYPPTNLLPNKTIYNH